MGERRSSSGGGDGKFSKLSTWIDILSTVFSCPLRPQFSNWAKRIERASDLLGALSRGGISDSKHW